METALRPFTELHPYLLDKEALMKLEFDDLLTIAENSDYFVRPSDYYNFMVEVTQVVQEVSGYYGYMGSEDTTRNKFGEVICKYVDLDFYKKAIKRLNKVENPNTKSKVLDEMLGLSIERLLELYKAIVQLRARYYVFMSSEDKDYLFDDLRQLAHSIDNSIALTPFTNDAEEMHKTLYKADSYLFAEILHKYTTRDNVLLLRLIRLFKRGSNVSLESFIEKEVKPYVKNQMGA